MAKPGSRADLELRKCCCDGLALGAADHCPFGGNRLSLYLPCGWRQAQIGIRRDRAHRYQPRTTTVPTYSRGSGVVDVMSFVPVDQRRTSHGSAMLPEAIG